MAAPRCRPSAARRRRPLGEDKAIDEAKNRRKTRASGEVEAAGHGIDLEAAIGRAVDDARHVEELLDADLAEDAGRQHEEGELAGERREDDLERRLEDDEAEDLPARQAERHAGIALAGRHRFDAGAHDLGRVGAEIDDQRDQRRRQRVEAEAEAGQPEIDEEELRQQRRVADRLDVAQDGAAQQPRARAGGERAGEADEKAQRDRRRAEPQRRRQPVEELVDSDDDGGEAEGIVHRPQRSDGLADHATIPAAARIFQPDRA